MQKKRKKKNAHAPRPRAEGFWGIFCVELRRMAIPVIAAAVLCVISALAAGSTDAAPAYVIFYILSAALCAAVAVTAARNTLAGAETVLARVPASDRSYIHSGTVTAARYTAILSASLFSAMAVFVSALFMTSVMLSVAAATAFMSAAFYLSILGCVTAASHDPTNARERRRFILGFAGMYTVGLLALIFIFACMSAIPLGDDFSEDAIPEGTVAAIAALYLLATVLRSVYLFFILHRRLRNKMKLRI